MREKVNAMVAPSLQNVGGVVEWHISITVIIWQRILNAGVKR
jgi:hypothetical protein